MAFDYGSIDLGLKNPFKLEGAVTAFRGAIQAVLGLYLLISAAGIVREDTGKGWILVVFGVLILAAGFRALGKGIYARMRYFVGRNHPTSLAKNFSPSEQTTSQEEASFVGYKAKTLEEMLMGRKNATFREPLGWLARLAHTFFPQLLFMPYPVRNTAQRLLGMWIKTIVALIAYAFVAFASLSGFAGEAGELAFPVYSVLFMVYLILIWHFSGNALERKAKLTIESLGSSDLVKVIVVSLMLPVVVGLGVSWFMMQADLTKADVDSWMVSLPDFSPTLYIFFILVLAVATSALIALMLLKRLRQVSPNVEVSELRENWQESVHPKEIFINLDNLVMANRRYREVPNRVYRALEPQLQEQAEGKGAFQGEMIQEVQPTVNEVDLGPLFSKARLASLLSGNLLAIVATVLLVALGYAMVDIYHFLKASGTSSVGEVFQQSTFQQFMAIAIGAIHLVLLTFILRAFARLLMNSAHLFFAEIQFQSLLVYFKCEGTFTESRISTGTGIHDSTRSENTLVRSSITPWVIVSRIVTSTFAATGMRNLEHPRHILEMHKDDAQLQSIRSDIMSFLKDRESIASITSQRDLGNASQIHELNQQTRAIATGNRIEQDEEAAGYLRQETDLTETPETS